MRNSTRSRKPRGNVRTDTFTLKGGLNLVDSPVSIPDGMALAAINFELLTTDGYRRAKGFERHDGRPKPSEASYWILAYDAGSSSGAPEVGGFCYGATSGATGEVIAVVLEAGTWAGGDAAGYAVISELTGSFQDDEAISFTGAGSPFSAGFSIGFS